MVRFLVWADFLFGPIVGWVDFGLGQFSVRTDFWFGLVFGTGFCWVGSGFEYFVKNSCARSLCECDKWSVENLKNVIQTTNPKYLAHRGFVAEEECKNIRKDQRTDRGKIECCGEYPNRLKSSPKIS